MFPSTLALVDQDAEHTDSLSRHLRAQGVQVAVFADSSDLLAGSNPFGFGFYVLDLLLPGIGGLDLIKLLRRRTKVGVVVLSAASSRQAFGHAMAAGADLYLPKPARFEELSLTIQAVHRRAVQPAQDGVPWRLDRLARQLHAPDGGRVDLSVADLAVMTCFVHGRGQPVTRRDLLAALGKDARRGAADGLTASIFRLRRRIEGATRRLQPLQVKPRVGYVFSAELIDVTSGG